MRKLTLTAAAAALLFAASCNNSSDQAKTDTEQTAAAATGKEYAADVTASNIHWQGTHKGGALPRYGTINITAGTISVENGALTAGSFDVDMNTIKVDSASVPEPADKGHKAIDLENHLKSADFFDVAKHPTAKFVITSVAPFDAAKDKSMLEGATNIISGNLTIKDSTINVTFPAKIAITDANVDVHAKFTVDRTSWGLRLGAEGDPANWMISKDLELEINLKAVAK